MGLISFGLAEDTLQSEELQFAERHMGTVFRITIHVDNKEDQRRAEIAADSAFQKAAYLNTIFSDYDADSELSRLSATSGSGQSVSVSHHLFEVLRISQMISEWTDGAFDVTVGPFSLAWREAIRGLRAEIPTDHEIREMAESVGYRHLELEPASRKVRLHRPGMRLDPGGIAKGYAADRMIEVLGSFGFNKVMVNAGGDMVIGAPPPGRKGWRIAIPAHGEDGEQDPFIMIVSSVALTTSGDMFQYITRDGVRYSHIVDPATGRGVTRQIMATVKGIKGVKVDALATALNIMPVDKGIALIENRPGYEARIEVRIDDAIKTCQTSGFQP